MRSALHSLVSLFLGSVALALVVPACSGADTQSVPASVCASGTQWIGNESGDERMHPGRDCINCHFGSGDDAPKWTLAGTVYGIAGQKNDCFGTSKVSVAITDAKGKQIVLTTNEAGNVYTLDSFVGPYSVTMNAGG